MNVHISVPDTQAQIIENVRAKLGMTRTAFYLFCVSRFLEDTGTFTRKVSEPKQEAKAIENRGQ